jgi:hypothetical protein
MGAIPPPPHLLFIFFPKIGGEVPNVRDYLIMFNYKMPFFKN